MNDPGDSFCGGCGGQLGADPPRADGLIRGERRQVAVLFADLCGFTRLSSELDPEQLHELVSHFLARVDEIVLRYGGHVDKHVGDAVMALFGAPVAHGDDPLRAALAAQDVIGVMPDLSRATGRALEAHLGLAEGEVIAAASAIGRGGRQDYTALGETVNLASRLCDRAAPGEALLSDGMRRALASHIEVQDIGELELEGLARPARGWRLLRIVPKRAETPAELIGRGAEIGRLRALLQSTASGSGGVAWIRADAGTGKTRLVETLRQMAESDGFETCSAAVLDFGVGRGRGAVASLVTQLLGLGASAETIAPRKVSTAAAAAGIVPGTELFVFDLLDRSPPAEARLAYDAMDEAAREAGRRATFETLVRMRAARPLLLVVEDLHWADAGVLAALEQLVGLSNRMPLLVAATMRPEGDPLDTAWGQRFADAPIHRIDLEPLGQEDALHLARRLSRVDEGVLRACVIRSEGNPLFLEQLLHDAQERTGGAIPGSIHGLVIARVDRIRERDRRAIQAAAAIGQRFQLDVLRYLLDDQTYDPAGLVAARLVRDTAARELAFTHALIRDGVYATLLRATKAALHGRLAEWFLGRDLGLRAQHLRLAGDPAAAAAFTEATRADAQALRFDRALALAEEGLAAAGDVRDRIALTALRAECLRELGRPRESVGAFRDALALGGTELERCRNLIGIASGVRLSGGMEEGIAALDEAEAIVERHGAVSELAQIHWFRGNFFFGAGDVSRCLEEHGLSLRFALQAKDPEWEARALSGLGDAEYARGHMRRANAYFRECQDLCRRMGFGRIDVGNTHMIGVTERYLNEFASAIGHVRAAAEQAHGLGNRRTEMAALTLLGEFLVDAGDLDGAERALLTGLDIAGALGNQRQRSYLLYERARAASERGEDDEAAGFLDEALGIGRETGITFMGPRILALKSVLAADASVARQTLDEGEAVLGRGCLAHNHLWFRKDAMEAALRWRDWTGLCRQADALEHYTRADPLPWADFFVRRARALAAYAQEPSDKARGTLAELRDEALRIGLNEPVRLIDRTLGLKKSDPSSN